MSKNYFAENSFCLLIAARPRSDLLEKFFRIIVIVTVWK